ncbi:MAG: ATP-binding protein, partial [Treponema sp.]|nr:ATP-binding protein [Treponema sp.]
NEIFLESGDLLYLYTDGITEAMNNEKTMFGEERLLDILNRNEDMFAQELLTAVMNEVNDFAEGAQQADDITMLGLQINEKATNVKGSFYEMEVIAKTRYLDDVIEFISGELDKSGMEGDIQKEICIAAEEIFINIAEYAYGTETGSVLISICADDEITILFEDSGKPYNPLEQPAPDLDKSPGDRQIGGLGIYMVKNIMDSIEYTRKNGKNILKITKNPRKNQLMTQF